MESVEYETMKTIDEPVIDIVDVFENRIRNYMSLFYGGQDTRDASNKLDIARSELKAAFIRLQKELEKLKKRRQKNEIH